MQFYIVRDVEHGTLLTRDLAYARKRHEPFSGFTTGNLNRLLCVRPTKTGRTTSSALRIAVGRLHCRACSDIRVLGVVFFQVNILYSSGTVFHPTRRYKLFSELMGDFRDSYAGSWHRLEHIWVGFPLPHDISSNVPVKWKVRSRSLQRMEVIPCHVIVRRRLL